MSDFTQTALTIGQLFGDKYIAAPLSTIFSWVKKAVDVNHAGLFEALNKRDWKTINASIKYPAVHQYAHDQDNILLFAAIEDKQFDLVDYLLTLPNVTAGTNNILDLIPHNIKPELIIMEETTSKVSIEDLMNRIAAKQWDLVEEVLNNPDLIGALSSEDIELLISQAFYNDELNICSKMGDLLSKSELPIFQARFNNNFNINPVVEEKPKTFKPIFDQATTEIRNHFKATENGMVVINEWRPIDTDSQHDAKRRKLD